MAMSPCLLEIKPGLGTKPVLKTKPVALAALLIALGLTAVGCDSAPTMAPVTGRVTFRGEPLQFGGVMLQPDAGQPARGTIATDGTFTLSTAGAAGAVLGKHKIRVTCYESQRPDAVVDTNVEPTTGTLLIPQRYTNYGRSGLTFEVKADEPNDLVIELTDE
jgi:hypothetical protein